MGACLSLSGGSFDVSDQEKMMHREAEKTLKEVSYTPFLLIVTYGRHRQAKAKMSSQVKVSLRPTTNCKGCF